MLWPELVVRRRLAILHVDADVMEEVVQRLLACKEVVDGKHTGHNIELRFQPDFLPSQILTSYKFSSQDHICKIANLSNPVSDKF